MFYFIMLPSKNVLSSYLIPEFLEAFLCTCLKYTGLRLAINCQSFVKIPVKIVHSLTSKSNKIFCKNFSNKFEALV